jgi:hypothetical protein
MLILRVSSIRLPAGIGVRRGGSRNSSLAGCRALAGGRLASIRRIRLRVCRRFLGRPAEPARDHQARGIPRLSRFSGLRSRLLSGFCSLGFINWPFGSHSRNVIVIVTSINSRCVGAALQNGPKIGGQSWPIQRRVRIDFKGVDGSANGIESVRWRLAPS